MKSVTCVNEEDQQHILKIVFKFIYCLEYSLRSKYSLRLMNFFTNLVIKQLQVGYSYTMSTVAYW